MSNSTKIGRRLVWIAIAFGAQYICAHANTPQDAIGMVAFLAVLIHGRLVDREYDDAAEQDTVDDSKS